MDVTKNAKTPPKVYYGLHFSEGPAEYADQPNAQGQPTRIFISEPVAKQMDATFAGKPVYVHHVDGVNLEKLQEEADGYVSESFYNKLDGKHWAKFIVVSDRGHEAIAKGWTLSNAYVIKRSAGGGEWHGMSYDQEVMEGEYEHLAIVPDPRYSESVILTPEEFKEYNQDKEEQLSRLVNSKDNKGETPMKFDFFKRTKVDNSAELSETLVKLTNSKVEKTIAEVITELDQRLVNEMKPYMCNGDEVVKVGDEEMTVKHLVEKYQSSLSAKEEEEKAENMDEADKDLKKDQTDESGIVKENKVEVEIESPEEAAMEAKMENEEPEEDKEDKKMNSHFDKLLNAHKQEIQKNTGKIVLSSDAVALGKARYGSN